MQSGRKRRRPPSFGVEWFRRAVVQNIQIDVFHEENLQWGAFAHLDRATWAGILAVST